MNAINVAVVLVSVERALEAAGLEYAFEDCAVAAFTAAFVVVALDLRACLPAFPSLRTAAGRDRVSEAEGTNLAPASLCVVGPFRSGTKRAQSHPCFQPRRYRRPRLSAGAWTRERGLADQLCR